MHSWTSSSTPVVASGLSSVEFYTSCILDVGLSLTWQAARRWADCPWLRGDDQLPFRVVKLGGSAAAEVGSLRVLRLGASQMFEQLTALDDEERLVRWKLISHPQTVSPFDSSSFVNYVASIRLLPVTVGSRTFVEWKGRFFTEALHAEQMRATLDSWCHVGFKNLQAYVLAQQQNSIPPVNPGMTYVSQPDFAFPTQSSSAAASYAAARNTFMPHRQSVKPQWQRCVGSLAQSGGVPILHGPDSASSLYEPHDGHSKASKSTYSSQADTSLSAGHTSGSQSLRQAGSHKIGSQQQPDLRHTQWQAQQPISGKQSGPRTDSSSQTTDSRLKSDMSSQQADSRSTSWNSSEKQEQPVESPAARKSVRDQLRKVSVPPQMANSQILPEGIDGICNTSLGGEKQQTLQGKTSSRHGTPAKQPQKLSADLLKQHEAEQPQTNMAPASETPQVDEALMHRLAQHLQASWNERETNATRTSFEEAAAELEERHRQLHKARRSAAKQGAQSPFSSPFATTYTSPFLQ